MSAAKKIENGTIRRGLNVPRLCIDVSIDEHSAHNFWSGLTEGNLGGIFVGTHNAIRPGTLVNVRLVMGGAHWDPIDALAEVSRMVEYGDGGVEPGIVLRFVDVDPAPLARIRRFVATVRDPLFFDD